MEQVEIFCENTGKSYPIEIGSTLREVKKVIFPQNHNLQNGEKSGISGRGLWFIGNLRGERVS